jgi:SAM-dependent methyltransferase
VSGLPPDFGGFSAVDRSGEPSAYAGYLDRVRDLEAVAEWKERSFSLLEPRPGARLLDVGCGTGDDVRALAPRVAPGGAVIGVDASASMLAEARRRSTHAGPGVEFRLADARRLDLPEGAVDGCRAERILQHLPDPAVAVAEMVRVLRRDGRMVIAEPDWGTLVVDSDDDETTEIIADAACVRVACGRAGRSLRRLLLAAGLRDVDVVARTLVVTDRSRADLLFDLSGAARDAARAGRLPAPRAERWLADLERAGGEGGFLAAMTSFMAWGRRA